MNQNEKTPSHQIRKKQNFDSRSVSGERPYTNGTLECAWQMCMAIECVHDTHTGHNLAASALGSECAPKRFTGLFTIFRLPLALHKFVRNRRNGKSLATVFISPSAPSYLCSSFERSNHMILWQPANCSLLLSSTTLLSTL